MKKIVGAVLLAMVLVVAQAQQNTLRTKLDLQDSTSQIQVRPIDRFSIGFEYGYTRNSLITNISNLPYTRYEAVGGFTIGIPLEYSLHPWVSLYADLNLTKKNYKYVRTDYYAGTYEEFKNTYVQLPLLARLPVLGGKRLKIFIDLGIYAGYWLTGHIKGTEPNILDLYQGTNNSNSIYGTYNAYNFSEGYHFDKVKDNRLELGWIAGAGVSYQLSPVSRLFIEARNTQGITDQQKHYMTNQTQRYNQTYSITVGYLVTLKTIRSIFDKHE